jgi:hypothetical protein
VLAALQGSLVPSAISKRQALTVALKTKNLLPQNVGLARPRKRLGCIFNIPNSKLQITNKSQITILNDQKNGINVKIKR